MIELSQKGAQLFDLLMQIPPDLDNARSLLQLGACNPDDVNRVALRFAEECWDEGVYPWDTAPNRSTAIGDYYWEEARPIPNLHSSHLYEVIELLLEYGLDPNIEIDETRACLKNGNMTSGEQFFRQIRRFSAGILAVFQGKATRYGGKRAAVSACCHFSNRP